VARQEEDESSHQWRDKRNWKRGHTEIVAQGPNVPGGVQYPETARAQLAGRGSPAADAISEPASSSYYGPGDTKDYWSWRSVGIWVAIAVVVGLFLFVIPLPHSFSGVANPPNGTLPSVGIPQGATVKGSWHSSFGTPVTFQIIRGYDWVVVYNDTAVSGSFSFTSTQSATYYFYTHSETGGSASYSGSYWSPIL